MEKNLDEVKPRYSEQILSVPLTLSLFRGSAVHVILSRQTTTTTMQTHRRLKKICSFYHHFHHTYMFVPLSQPMAGVQVSQPSSCVKGKFL